ncbi:MAG: branched-chain amino acid ABC transporter permease, partial [Thermodesulfobacteriota bacterium]
MKQVLKNTNLWAAVILALLPLVLSEDNLRFLCLAGIYAIAALGMSLLLGYAGQISLGHAAFVGIGGYTSALLVTRYHCPSLLALPAAAAAASLAAYLIGKPILKTKGYFLALATLGFGEIFHVFCSRTTPVIGGLVGLGGIPYFSLA